MMVALVDHMTGVVGPGERMVSDRVFERFEERRLAFSTGIGTATYISISPDEERSEPLEDTPTSGVHHRNARLSVRHLGEDEARRRLTTAALAATAAAERRFALRRDLLRAMAARVSSDPSAREALSLRFSLKGPYYDPSRELPFLPSDSARLLQGIVKSIVAVPGWEAMSVVDATDRGHAHIHVVLTLPVADRGTLHGRILAAYDRYGINARGGVCLRHDATVRRAWLVTARQLPASIHGDRAWTYALDKTNPQRTDEAHLRRAAWLVVFRIRNAVRFHGVSGQLSDTPEAVAHGSTPKAGPRTRPMAGPGQRGRLDAALANAGALSGDQTDS